MSSSKKRTFLICFITAGTIIILAILFLLIFPHTKTIKGTYAIREIKTGKTVITSKDADELGINIGYFKFKKDGSCEIKILEDKYKGHWEKDGDGYFIEYNKTSASADKKGKYLFIEDQSGTKYTLFNSLA